MDRYRSRHDVRGAFHLRIGHFAGRRCDRSGRRAVVGLGIADSSSAGNWLAWLGMSISQTIVSGDVLPILSGLPQIGLS